MSSMEKLSGMDGDGAGEDASATAGSGAGAGDNLSGGYGV